MKEQIIQKKIITHIQGMGGYVVNVIKSSKSGVPDLLCCIEGRFVAIEVKRPETKTNVAKLQVVNIDWVIDAGGLAGVAWDIQSLEEILKDL